MLHAAPRHICNVEETIDAAKILKIADRTGSLEKGKDGDVALYDGDPFEYTSHCVGTVINGQGIMQSSVVRENANIPEDQVIMTCVAMGWPDEDFEANHVQSRRAPVESAAEFVGFD